MRKNKIILLFVVIFMFIIALSSCGKKAKDIILYSDNKDIFTYDDKFERVLLTTELKNDIFERAKNGANVYYRCPGNMMYKLELINRAFEYDDLFYHYQGIFIREVNEKKTYQDVIIIKISQDNGIEIIQKTYVLGGD